MKIRKVKWSNHKILGDLELDFVNPDTNRPYDTVVFAGENGSGKTTAMESIFNFLNLEHPDFEELEYEVAEDSVFKAYPTERYPNNGFHRRKDVNTGLISDILVDRSNRIEQLNSDTNDPRHYGSAFSKAQSVFKTDRINATSTLQLDKERSINDNENDYTRLKQLLVDIYSQDNNQYTEQNKLQGSNPIPWNTFYPTSKMFRFTNAFNNFFDDIKFSKIEPTSDNGYQILFNKHSKDISIDTLSTGEKQIVFRGSSLLKNCKMIADGVAFIDEPEISMHPRWQKKVLKYYKDIFSDGTRQTSQCFFATHSDYVISSALEDRNNTLVVVLSDDGTIKKHNVSAPSILPTITTAETNYLAFNVITNDYHIELYGYLQTKFSLSSVKLCDDYIKGRTQYIPAIHDKHSCHNTTNYTTICTYIRNAIDHPDNGNTFTEEELRISVELLIELCK